MSGSAVTLVTAVFDLSRERLQEGFRRDPDHYRRHLPAVLQIDCPMVVYTEPAFVEQVKSLRQGKPTRIMVGPEASALPPDQQAQIDRIRQRPEWLAQADWLPQSPQAALDGYNALVMSKVFWLEAQARANPFGSTHVYWIDAGIGHTVAEQWLKAQALVRLPSWHRHFLLLCYPYGPTGEVHGFERRALANLAGVDDTRWVARGGFFGGARHVVTEVAESYRRALAETLDQGLMGTEESVLTLLSYRHAALFDLQLIDADGLVWPFFQRLTSGELGQSEAAHARMADLIETWFVSFNTPQQFAILLEAIDRVVPVLLRTGARTLINNSTDPAVQPDYDRLCTRYGIRQLREDNIGINGARQLAAEHFQRQGRFAMFWFEDDMLPVGAGEEPALCRNGLPRHVPALAEHCLAIVQQENADYLACSFTEVFGTHAEQWAWKNLDADKRAHYFPGVESLPPALLSAPKQLGDVRYAIGEVYYSNWPHLITRRGTQRLLLDERRETLYEQHWCARSFELLRAEELRAAVLLASPINHCRTQHYRDNDRRESLPSSAAQHWARTARIFVSIANYRDSEAPHTLRDLFAKAAYPDRLMVGMLSQVVPEVDADCLPDGGYPPHQLRELRVDASASLGACWARHRILTELAGDEDYVLQIDSHSRFVQGWDERFVAMLADCPSPRALLTTYPASYRPPNELGEACTPVLGAQEFNTYGVLLVKGVVNEALEFPRQPKPSAFLSGNCLFGPAQAFREVPYDPWLYFHGEEISLAVRFWTHGWDMFAPNDLLMYTDYSTDRGRPRHWTDQQDWAALNGRSFARLRHLFGLQASTDPEVLSHIDRFGLGQARSLADYEAYADVCFGTRYIGFRALDACFDRRGAEYEATAGLPTIFVSVVNDRDPDIGPTLRDLFARASRPHKVVVGVLSLHAEGEVPQALPTDGLPAGRIRELRLPAEPGLGQGWARQRIANELLADERFVLQIDSGSRFAQGWDDFLCATLAACPAQNAVLSGMASPFRVGQRPQEACLAVPGAAGFLAPGVLTLRRCASPLSDRPEAPTPSAFVSFAGLFAPARLFREVPYDPHLAAEGEEAAYSARLWTHGWDIYAPNGAFLFHDDDRQRRQATRSDLHATQAAARSRARLGELFGLAQRREATIDTGIAPYGLGSVRPLADYAALADLDFASARLRSS